MKPTIEQMRTEVATKKSTPKLPLQLPQATLPTAQEMQAIADRVARQQAGEHVTKPGETTNLAGRSIKEAARVRKVPYGLTPTGGERVTPTYEAKKGDINVGLPGDQTVADARLEHVAGIPINSQQEGGARYGEGKQDLPEAERPFWASGQQPAQGFQNKVNELAQLTGEKPSVIAHHLAMGRDSNHFAMHFADANLKAITNSGVKPENQEAFNQVVRNGFVKKNQKGEYVHIAFPHFPGIHKPKESFAAMQQDPEMRKWFNNRMKKPNVTKALGLPNGLDIEYAITEPALRNLEISMTGHSVGKMRPGAELVEGADHNTYSHKILGDALGAAPELAPVDIAFPDASDYIRKHYSPSDFTGTIQKVYPHQIVDDRFLNHINEYYAKLRKARGFAKGGNVEPDKDTMLAHLMLHKTPDSVNIKDVGVNEAPDLPVKAFVSPNGGNGENLPIGGVDFQPLTPGNQLMPMQAGQQPGQSPAPAGQSPAMPGQSPAPPPRPGQPQSNILSLTRPGQAMQALRPNPQAMPQQPGPTMPKMAEGGQPPVEEMRKAITNKIKISKTAPRTWAGTGFGDKGASYGIESHPHLMVIRESHGWTARDPNTKQKWFGEDKNELENELNKHFDSNKMKKGGGVEVKPTVKDETIQRKIPEMEDAAKALQAGTITRKEYDKVVKQHKPVKPYEFVPRPATDEDAERALMANKKAQWRGHEQWPAGRKVGLRLDIPAYENHGVWVNSIHDEEGSDKDKYPTAYNSVSSVKNATFDAKPEKAVRVATGEQNKSPFARIRGELHHMTEDEAVEHMKAHLNHPDYVQVGMDPRRHGFFYDRKTMKPITHSAHVVQIGPLVLAHNPTYGKRETYAKGGSIKPVGYTKERVTVSPNLDAMRYEMESVKRYTKKAK
jgi:hypothetical protein